MLINCEGDAIEIYERREMGKEMKLCERNAEKGDG